MGSIIIAGIGPGSQEDITPAVLQAVRGADAIVGYKYYFQFIESYGHSTKSLSGGKYRTVRKTLKASYS